MRLDKYLKESGIIKRRTIAAEVANAGKIKLNDRQAKASSTVKVDDILEISLGDRVRIFKVLNLMRAPGKGKGQEMYEEK